MDDDTASVGGLPRRSLAFATSVFLLTGLFTAGFSTFVVYQESAVPALFDLASALGIGANAFLLVSFVLASLVSYVVVYRIDLGPVRSLVNR